MRTTRARSNQSIPDLAIQHCGSIEAIYQICVLNRLNVDDELTPGQVITLPGVVDKKVVELFKQRGINPATAAVTTLDNTAKFGLLYNFYAVTDPRNIAPAGWHHPTWEEYATLIAHLGGLAIAGGKLKAKGTSYWKLPNTGATNESGWNGRGGGFTGPAGYGCVEMLYQGFWWTATQLGEEFPNQAYFLNLNHNNSIGGLGNTYLYYGGSVRLIKDNAVFTKSLTDIDGNEYKIIKIGNQVWMAENLKVTRYRNGDTIPEIINNDEWSALTSGARCAYVVQDQPGGGGV